jgi:integrase
VVEVTERRSGRSGRRANGEGSIYLRRDGRWAGAVFLPTPSGAVKRVQVYGRSRDEVHRKVTVLLRQAQQGIPVADRSWTVGAYLDYWLQHVVRPRLRPKTYVGYEGVVRLHLKPALGAKRVERLSVRDVRGLLDDRRAQGLSVRMVQFIHAVLRNALQQAVREELVARNVAQLVRVEVPQYEVGRGITVADARRFLAAIRADRLYALYVLALTLGLRKGELLGLRWADVDLDRGELEVRQTLQRISGELRVQPPKTKRSRRTIPLPAPCVDALREHRARQAAERLRAGERWKDSGLVFMTRVGSPLEPRNLNRHFYSVRRAGGLAVRFHDLRHTCVSLLLDLGVPPHVVREIVGHSDIEVTMTIYAHASLDEQRKALGRLGEVLG